MNIKCLIVDDEPLAIRIIENHCARIEDLEVVATCESAVEAFSILQKQRIDLLFLDIQMPELTGFELLKTLPHPPQVIITTAYREYALEGYELDVTDYILKPIAFDRFLKAIQKVYRKADPDYLLEQKVLQSAVQQEDEFLLVKVRKKLVKVLLKEILYIENVKEYVKIKTRDREVVTKMLISELEKILPENEFLRIHRSFIISLSKIESLSPSEVEINGEEIPIGRSYKSVVLKKLNY